MMASFHTLGMASVLLKPNTRRSDCVLTKPPNDREAEPIAPHEPPLLVSCTSWPVNPTLDLLPAPASGGGGRWLIR